MRTRIDQTGRIVVPKPLRDALGLESGTTLEIRAREGRLELEAVALPMRLVRKGKGLVARADTPLPKVDAEKVRAILESQRR